MSRYCAITSAITDMPSPHNHKSKPLDPQQALRHLERKCARSEHCVSELRRTLAGWHIQGTAADEIIQSLQCRRFVDDSRYARAFVRDKLLFNHWGRVKIVRQLQVNRVDETCIRAAIESIDSEEYIAIANEVIRREATRCDIADYSQRQKLYLYGLRRGFESSIVAGIIRQLHAGNTAGK